MAFTPLRLAVVGAGAFGRLHARTIAQLAEVELTAVVDVRLGTAQTLASECGAGAAFATLEELIEGGGAEAAIIATRTASHLALAQIAMAAGLHVLIEKPVGSSAVEVAAFADFCRDRNEVAMAGHICLFHSLVGPLIERVRRHGFRAAHFVRHRPATLAQLFPEEHPIPMTMLHDLYVLAVLVGHEEPGDFDAVCSCGPEGKDDMAWATLRWTDGRVATLHSHWTLPAGAPPDGWDSTEVFGAGYHAAIVTNPQNMQWTDASATWPRALEISSVEGAPTGMLAEEIRAFASACRTGIVPAGCRMLDALQVQRWVEALLKSARAHKVAS